MPPAGTSSRLTRRSSPTDGLRQARVRRGSGRHARGSRGPDPRGDLRALPARARLRSSRPRRDTGLLPGALGGGDRGLRRDRRVEGPCRRVRNSGTRRRTRHPHRGRLPQCRRAPGGPSHTDSGPGVDTSSGPDERPRLPRRLERSRYGGGPRHCEHARLRSRPRNRALGALGRRDRPAHRRDPRRRRRGEADARPHAGHDHRDPPAQGRRHRRLRRDGADAAPLHPQGERQPLRAPRA